MNKLVNSVYTKARSDEWLRAYIFASLEKKLLEVFVHSAESYMEIPVIIPKVWFGVKCSQKDTDDISRDRKEKLSALIREDLSEFFPRYTAELITWKTVHQYIEVNVRFFKETSKTELQKFLRVVDETLHKEVKCSGNTSITMSPHITRSELRELCSQFGINYEQCVSEEPNGN